MEDHEEVSTCNKVPELTREEKLSGLEKMDFGKNSQCTNSEMSVSQISTTSNSSNVSDGSNKKTSLISPDPTAYVTKARVTRPAPPPPPYNPMQFVQIKPCSLYQTAQQQLKKAEEVKKIKEIKKEESEDWQNNLDSWKSSRRKRVEHIIDRVVEVKKLELEEHDRTRRKSKTFSEMMEERGERNGGKGLTKLASLVVYNEEESNDFSDLGIGTSSVSGKSSLSEDCDNNSILSDNNEPDKTTITERKVNANISTTREFISSPGYETSSTVAASSPDVCEYTYDGAIQDYKQRVSRATSANKHVFNQALRNISNNQQNVSAPDRSTNETNDKDLRAKEQDCFKKTYADYYPIRRGSKIEDRLSSFEVNSPSDTQDNAETKNIDVPKIDISKRKEIFEQQQMQQQQENFKKTNINYQLPKQSVKINFKFDSNEGALSPKKDVNKPSCDIVPLKARLQSLEQQTNACNKGSTENNKNGTTAARIVDISVPPLKERLSSFQNATIKEEVKKHPVPLIDARQLEIMKSEEEKTLKLLKEEDKSKNIVESLIEEHKMSQNSIYNNKENDAHKGNEENNQDDSGIHTADDVNEIECISPSTLPNNKKDDEDLQLAAIAVKINKSEPDVAELSDEKFKILQSHEPTSIKQKNFQINKPQFELQQPVTQNQQASQHESQEKFQPQSESETQQQSQRPLIEMEFSVSCTNNENKSFCLNRSSTELGKGSSIDKVEINNEQNKVVVSQKGSRLKTSNDDKINDLSISGGIPPKSINLKRKPSNEMIHHRNLLRIFKETFNNEIDIEESVEDNSPFETFQKVPQTPDTLSPLNESENQKQDTPSSLEPSSKHPTMIPCSTNVAPIYPKPQNVPPSNNKCDNSITSPIINNKLETQFSINGRVEIFNSKDIKHDPKPIKKTSSIPIAIPLVSISEEGLRDVKNVSFCTGAKDSSVNSKNDLPSNIKTKAEIVKCSPAMTVPDPEEFPKPNTVKSLKVCFDSVESSNSNPLPDIKKTKPRAKNPIPTTPPSCLKTQKTYEKSFVPKMKNSENSIAEATGFHGTDLLDSSVELRKNERNLPMEVHTPSKLSPLSNPNSRTTSIQSTDSAISTDSGTSVQTVINTKAIVDPDANKIHRNIQALSSDELLKPNDVLEFSLNEPSVIPQLIVCEPNISSLYKLSSNSSSPINSRKLSDNIVLQTSYDVDPQHSVLSEILTSCESLPLTDQNLVDEKLCTRIDINDNPNDKNHFNTAFADVSTDHIRRCDGFNVKSPSIEKPCSKIDIHNLPKDKNIPATEYKEIEIPSTKYVESSNISPISAGQQKNVFSPSSKPGTPILEARAAHSKALIDTCERIIAEERKTAHQMKSVIPLSPKSVNKSNNKSKIPKPINCCIAAGGSLTRDECENLKYSPTTQSLATNSVSTPVNEGVDGIPTIARMHVIESEIKVTTTTPPATPTQTRKTVSPLSSPRSPNNPKKSKNIFDFLRKNFGHAASSTCENSDQDNSNINGSNCPESVKENIILKVDNSQFYVPVTGIENINTQSDEELASPPPLPISPIPVHIELKKVYRTHEILEGSKDEFQLSQEINDLLDDELDKLNSNKRKETDKDSTNN